MFLSSSSEAFVVFSGGLSYDKAGRRPTLTIMHGKAITVLEMDYPIVDFMVLCDTPYINGEYAERFSLLSSISVVLFLGEHLIGLSKLKFLLFVSL